MDSAETDHEAEEKKRRHGWRKRLKRERSSGGKAQVGAAPGTLVAHPDAEPPVLTLTGLHADATSDVIHDFDLERLAEARASYKTIWLDCTGLGDANMVERIGRAFGFHPLALEDVLNVGQRPKTEFFDAYVFTVLHMLDDNGVRSREQLSLFAGSAFVVTFQERKGDSFDPVRKRIAQGGRRLFDSGADYLAYALIDAVIDRYFPLFEQRGEEIDRIEDDVLEEPEPEQLAALYGMRREMRHLQRSLWPLRDAISALVRSDRGPITDQTQMFLTDTQDHTIQLVEMLDTYRDTINGLIELHMSLSQARTNEVVNLLTIVSTIFIPLGFLAGLWGMNFDPGVSPWNMPELSWYFGYPLALGLMAVVAIGLLIFFRRRGWI